MTMKDKQAFLFVVFLLTLMAVGQLIALYG